MTTNPDPCPDGHPTNPFSGYCPVCAERWDDPLEERPTKDGDLPPDPGPDWDEDAEESQAIVTEIKIDGNR